MPSFRRGTGAKHVASSALGFQLPKAHFSLGAQTPPAQQADDACDERSDTQSQRGAGQLLLVGHSPEKERRHDDGPDHGERQQHQPRIAPAAARTAATVIERHFAEGEGGAQRQRSPIGPPGQPVGPKQEKKDQQDGCDMQTGDNPLRPQTGHTPARTQTGHTSNRTQSGHTPIRTQSGLTPNWTQTGHAPTQTQTGHAPHQTQSGHTPIRTQTGHAPNRTQTGHTPNRTQSGHAPARTQTGHASNRTQTGLTPNRTQTGHASIRLQVTEFSTGFYSIFVQKITHAN